MELFKHEKVYSWYPHISDQSISYGQYPNRNQIIKYYNLEPIYNGSAGFVGRQFKLRHLL